ncbi:hypothetical protein [Candidatus Neptunichlamydia sp. REUL1]|uniref:hypothetical protein n=1 Tax=Candidatus Neptunichlamydia sp. REUL1 TaxID=3064277 RepID=UPI002931684B|nr:hypothetical protein [Candidatus Neptunochlamydia sp. REUL1]
MAAIVGPADALMKATGKLVGNFKVQIRYKEEGNDINALNALGLVINNIVSSCTFRPPLTASELRMEFHLISVENKLIGRDKFDNLITLPATLEEPNNTDSHKSVYNRMHVYNAEIVELQRHQDTFNPVGGLAVAGVVILLAYSVANWIGNTFIPYMIRENYKLGIKCMAGGTMVMLTKESVEGWARMTDGQLRSTHRECRER